MNEVKVMTSADEQTVLPPVVYTARLTRRLALRLTMYGTALLYVALVIVFSVGGGSYDIGSLGRFSVMSVIALVSAVATLIVHEGVHGAVFRLYGGRPRYGVGCVGGFMPYAYATVLGMPFTLWQMTVICLAPFVLISTAAFCAMWFVPLLFVPAAAAFVTNVSGSIGDLWFTAGMWQFRRCRDLLLVDSRDSMDFHTSDPRGPAIAAALADETGGILRRLVLRSIVAISVIAFAAPPLGIVLSMLNAPDVTLGPSLLPIVVYRTMGGRGLSIELDWRGLLVAGIVCGALSLALRRRRNETQPEGTSQVPRPAFF
jgi:hypothetical protein